MVSIKYAVRLEGVIQYMGPKWRADQIAEGLVEKYGQDRVRVEAVR